MLAGCTNIVQKDYSNATDSVIINIPVNALTSTTTASSRENQNASASQTQPNAGGATSELNVDAATLGFKVATGITTTLLTTLTYLAYTDNLLYAVLVLPIVTGQTVIASTGYICINYYNRKASPKEIQHFQQRMQQAQPKENEECPICLEPGNSNQPLYPLPDCPCPSHYFHRKCIITYIQATPLRLLKCPVCRTKMDMNAAINKSLTKRHVAA